MFLYHLKLILVSILTLIIILVIIASTIKLPAETKTIEKEIPYMKVSYQFIYCYKQIMCKKSKHSFLII